MCTRDGPAHAHLQQPAAGEPDRLGVADRPAAVGLEPRPARPRRPRSRACAPPPSAPGRARQRAPSRSNANGARCTGRTCRPGVPGALSDELAVARPRAADGGAGRAAGAPPRPSSAASEREPHDCGFASGARVPPAAPAGCRLRSPMRTLCLLAVALIAGLALTPGAAAATPHVRVVVLDADVDPVTADWVVDEIHAADNAHDSAARAAARHAGRPARVDAQDHAGRAALARADHRLRRPERRARGQRRLLPAPGGRHRGHGAGLEHRRRHADRHGRRQRRQRPALQADPRRRGADALPRRRQRPQRDGRRAGGRAQEQRLPALPPQLDRRRGAAGERDRRRRRRPARAARADRRTRHGAQAPAARASPAPRSSATSCRSSCGCSTCCSTPT